MAKPSVWVPCALAMVVVIAGLDLLFFRQRQYAVERLLVNAGVVLVFAAFYLRFLRHL